MTSKLHDQQHLYVIFEMASESDDFKAYYYLKNLGESLKTCASVDVCILGSYKGPTLSMPGCTVRATGGGRRGLEIGIHQTRQNNGNRLKRIFNRYWFSSMKARHYEALKWMQNWKRPDAKTVFIAKNAESGKQLLELMYLYAKEVPAGVIVVLQDATDLTPQYAQIFSRRGVTVLVDELSDVPTTFKAFDTIRSFQAASAIQAMSVYDASMPIDWSAEVEKAGLLERNPEKILFVRPDWMKCGSATTFGKVSGLLRERGAIVIDVALQRFREKNDAEQIENKLREVAKDFCPSFHFSMQRGSKLERFIAEFKSNRKGKPKTVAGVMPVMYLACNKPPMMRSLIADAKIDYLYVNHYFCFPYAKEIRPDRPVFLDTHDIQSTNYISHDYHRGMKVPAATFEECLEEEISIVEQADQITMVSWEESELFSRLRSNREFFYYIPVPPAPELSGDENADADEGGRPLRLLIVASQNPANERSMAWFFKCIWPHIPKDGIELEIVGGIYRSFETKTFDKVTFAGFVVDLGSAYRKADIVLLPVTNGGGIGIKTIEAIQFGKPIIATEHAMRGLPPTVKAQLPCWSNASEFVQDIQRMLKDETVRRERIANVRSAKTNLLALNFDRQMHGQLNRMLVQHRGKKRYVIVPPASPGSKGDEGMMRGCLEVIADLASSIVIMNLDDAPRWTDAITEIDQKLQIVELTGNYARHYERLTASDNFVCIGADVVDGTCGLDPSLSRLDLLEHANNMGAQCFVFGSFRSDVHPQIIARIQALNNVRFYWRDMHSLGNFRKQTGQYAEYFPDLFVFCPEINSEKSCKIRGDLQLLKQGGKPLIGVNFCEHAFRSFHDEHTDANRMQYVAEALKCLLDATGSHHLVLLSNDNRRWGNHPSDADYQEMAMQWLCANHFADRAYVVDPSLSYAETLTVLDELDFAVSGRMHLALACFRKNVIPIILMGIGKGYTSIDKMRGAHDKYLKRTDFVVSDLAGLNAASTLALKDGQSVRRELQEIVQSNYAQSLLVRDILRVQLVA